MAEVRVYVTEEDILITDEAHNALNQKGGVKQCFLEGNHYYLSQKKEPIPVGSFIMLQRPDGRFDYEDALKVKRYGTLQRERFLAIVAQHAEDEKSLKHKILDVFGMAETLEDAVLKEINKLEA